MEQKIKLGNKKAMTVSVPILVLFTLLVVGLALFYFTTTKLSIDKKLDYSQSALSSFYEKEFWIDFYIQDAAEKAAKSVSSKTEFISRFKIILDYYKYPDNSLILTELDEIKNKLNEDSVEIIEADGKKLIKLNVDINFKEDFKDKQELIFSADYRYFKVFEAEV